VDTADYTIWADSFGDLASESFAPGSYLEPDHVVSTADYTIWADHFGDSNMLLNATALSMPAAPQVDVPPVTGGASVGDFNEDGRVDQADYAVWQDNAGKHGKKIVAGDANGDKKVNQADLSVWYDHFGEGVNR